jgi:hypothetical protein
MINTYVVDTLIRLAEIGSASYGTVWFTRWLDRRNVAKSLDVNNMEADYKRKEIIVPILEEIRYKLGADRVLECSFSNGDTTFSGSHMKKVSVTHEVYAEDRDQIGQHFQLIPAKKFERPLELLYKSATDYIISDETRYSDELSILNISYGISYMLLIKTRDSNNKWIGYILISFQRPVTLSQEDIIYAKTQASAIGGMKEKS